MALKLGMLHWVLDYCQGNSNGELVLTLSFLQEGELWENARIYDFIEKFEDFGLKIGTYSFLNQCMKI